MLTATARPQGKSDQSLSTALSAQGTIVVPVDERGCRKDGAGSDAATPADDGSNGNPAVQQLTVRKKGVGAGTVAHKPKHASCTYVLCFCQLHVWGL